MHQYPLMGPIPQRSTWGILIHPIPSHVNHEVVVTVVETAPFVLLELTGPQYELLLYAALASINLPKLRQLMVSRTHVRLLLR